MKFGLVPINIGVATPEQMITTAQAAEAAGFESVWTFEHVIVPTDYASAYPYNKSGKMGAVPETPFVDPLIALTAIAANTKTIRLGTGVNIVAQANALLLAKQAASLDFLSGGRFMLGAGIGWLREEFTAMGVPFERRGARFDDYMVAMKKVWSGEVVEHESDFLSWHGFKSYPLPVQKTNGASGVPGIPIIMGGKAGKIYERIARHGDGWFIPGAGIDDLPAMLADLRAACEAEGRNYDDIELTTMWGPKGGADSLKALTDLGITRVVTILDGSGVDGINAIAEAHIR